MKKKRFTRPELEAMSKEALIDVVLVLQGIPKKTSQNSSLPPSQDKKAAVLPHESDTGRPSGGQPGHAGKTREVSTEPDVVVKVPLLSCPVCGSDFEPPSEAGSYRRHQLIDLVPAEFIVVEVQRERRYCRGCQQTVTAPNPSGIADHQEVGPYLEGIISYFHTRHHVPQERIQEVLGAVYGLELGSGTIPMAIERVSAKLESEDTVQKEALKDQKLLGADETSYRVAGRNFWLWVFQNAAQTYYHIDPHRSSAVVKGVLGEQFAGILISDFFSAYGPLEATKQKCNAHLLRELKFIKEAEPQSADYVEQLTTVLLEAKALKEQRGSLEATVYASLCQELRSRFEHLLGVNVETWPEAARIQQRLRKHQDEILLFLYREKVPFDNNTSEQAIRKAVIHRKVSQCFRTEKGARLFFRLLTHVETAAKQGVDILGSLILGTPLFALFAASQFSDTS